MEEAIDIIIEALDKSNLEPIVKVELMMNIRKFLLDYEENIRILRKEEKKWKT